ncbi:MAG: hypothetical protein R3F14_38425 [Polyangiaceae bacterium]
MTNIHRIAAVVLLCTSVVACQEVGECWYETEGGQGAGVGGGPIGPGAGGFGEAPPEPQSADEPLPPDCQIVPQGACFEKCLSDYEEAAAVCGKMEDEAQRQACQDVAYAAYKSCRTQCTKQQNDCLEHCKDLCYQLWEKCRDDCPKGDANCLSECTNKLADCNRECDRKCK